MDEAQSRSSICESSSSLLDGWAEGAVFTFRSARDGCTQARKQGGDVFIKLKEWMERYDKPKHARADQNAGNESPGQNVGAKVEDNGCRDGAEAEPVARSFISFKDLVRISNRQRGSDAAASVAEVSARSKTLASFGGIRDAKVKGKIGSVIGKTTAKCSNLEKENTFATQTRNGRHQHDSNQTQRRGCVEGKDYLHQTQASVMKRVRKRKQEGNKNRQEASKEHDGLSGMDTGSTGMTSLNVGKLIRRLEGPHMRKRPATSRNDRSFRQNEAAEEMAEPEAKHPYERAGEDYMTNKTEAGMQESISVVSIEEKQEVLHEVIRAGTNVGDLVKVPVTSRTEASREPQLERELTNDEQEKLKQDNADGKAQDMFPELKYAEPMKCKEARTQAKQPEHDKMPASEIDGNEAAFQQEEVLRFESSWCGGPQTRVGSPERQKLSSERSTTARQEAVYMGKYAHVTGLRTPRGDRFPPARKCCPPSQAVSPCTPAYPTSNSLRIPALCPYCVPLPLWSTNSSRGPTAPPPCYGHEGTSCCERHPSTTSCYPCEGTVRRTENRSQLRSAPSSLHWLTDEEAEIILRIRHTVSKEDTRSAAGFCRPVTAPISSASGQESVLSAPQSRKSNMDSQSLNTVCTPRQERCDQQKLAALQIQKSWANYKAKKAQSFILVAEQNAAMKIQKYWRLHVRHQGQSNMLPKNLKRLYCVIRKRKINKFLVPPTFERFEKIISRIQAATEGARVRRRLKSRRVRSMVNEIKEICLFLDEASRESPAETSPRLLSQLSSQLQQKRLQLDTALNCPAMAAKFLLKRSPATPVVLKHEPEWNAS